MDTEFRLMLETLNQSGIKCQLPPGQARRLVIERMGHESYRKKGGRLDYTDWCASGQPKCPDATPEEI